MTQGIAFLCVRNTARSQMAEGWARKLLPQSVPVFSAGSQPADAVHPMAVRAMAEVGVDLAGHRPKLLATLPLAEIDTVAVLCAEEECPYLPGKLRRLDWKMPDPAKAIGNDDEVLDAFRAARDSIRSKIEALARDG